MNFNRNRFWNRNRFFVMLIERTRWPVIIFTYSSLYTPAFVRFNVYLILMRLAIRSLIARKSRGPLGLRVLIISRVTSASRKVPRRRSSRIFGAFINGFPLLYYCINKRKFTCMILIIWLCQFLRQANVASRVYLTMFYRNKQVNICLKHNYSIIFCAISRISKTFGIFLLVFDYFIIHIWSEVLKKRTCLQEKIPRNPFRIYRAFCPTWILLCLYFLLCK